MISQVSTHVATALSRVIQQYKQSPRLRELISIYAEQLQEVEDALAGIRTARDVTTATGVSLDQVGAMVGAIRSGFSDADFRDIINATVAANWSDGLESDLTALLKDFYGAGASLTFKELGRATSVYRLTDFPLLFEPRFVMSFVNKAKAAGTRVYLHYLGNTAALSFQFSSQSGTVETSTSLGLAANPADRGRWLFDTSSISPGGLASGDFRINTASWLTATEIYVHDTDADVIDRSTNLGNANGELIRLDSGGIVTIQVRCTGSTDNTTYYTLSIVTENVYDDTEFVNNNSVEFFWPSSGGRLAGVI